MVERELHRSEPELRQINESEEFIYEAEIFDMSIEEVIEIEGSDEEKELRKKARKRRRERIIKSFSFASNLTLRGGTSVNWTFGFNSSKNICYMNTGLQCLYNCAFFNEYLADLQILDKQSLLYHYVSLLQSIMKRIEPTVHNWLFQLAFEKLYPEFKRHTQNDCHEFIVLTVNKLHEDLMNEDLVQVESIESSGEKNWEDFLMKNRTVIAENMFGLFLITRVCSRCEVSVCKYEPFLMIPVIPPCQTEKNIEVILVYEDNKRLARQFYFIASEHSLARDIKAEISSKEAVPPDHVIIALVSNRDVYQMIVSDEEHIHHCIVLFAYICSRPDYVIVESLNPSDARFPRAKLSYNSYPRLIPIDRTWSLSNLYKEVFRYYYEILNPESNLLVEEEFRQNFPRLFGEEGENLLRLRFNNKEFNSFAREPCVSCHDFCFRCEIPFNEDSIECLYNTTEELPVVLEIL